MFMTAKKGKAIVAGDENTRKSLGEILSEIGYDIASCSSGREVMGFFSPQMPDVVFIDVILPDMTGYEVFRELKASGQVASVFFIFLVEDGGIFHKTEHVSYGQYRYLKKPLDQKSVESVLGESPASGKVRLKPSPEKRSKAHYIIDELTGLYNRNYLDERLKEEFSRARRYQYPVSLALIRLDGFDKMRTFFSRAQTDGIIKQMADVMRRNVRGIDILTRYGEGSFAVLLPQTGRKGATTLGEKLRRILHRHLFFGIPGQNRFTASIGIAACNHGNLSSIMKLESASNRALKSAQRHGNKVQVVWL